MATTWPILLIAGALLGVNVRIGCPPASTLEEVVAQANDRSRPQRDRHSEDPAAVRGTHAVYTDVWASMGQKEQSTRVQASAASAWMVLMSHADARRSCCTAARTPRRGDQR